MAANLGANKHDHDDTTAPQPQADVKGKSGAAAIKGEKTLAELAQSTAGPIRASPRRASCLSLSAPQSGGDAA